MQKISLLLILSISLVLHSCSKAEDSSSSFASSSASDPANNPGNTSGLITAGEWNDLDNWSFWTNLISGTDFSDKPSYWDFYNDNRVSIILSNANEAVVNAKLELFHNSELVWEARTDNYGKAEMWINLYAPNTQVDMSAYNLSINGQAANVALSLFQDGVNEIELSSNPSVANKIELAFIVDATGSMSDELEFLKDDLADVIQRVQNNSAGATIYTSSVFYRDEGDDYIVRTSNFSNSPSTTFDFIAIQNANGGGDYPEAVHSALNAGINDLQWSDDAKTRIAFILLDAPPHHEIQVMGQLQTAIKEAAKKGIKLIPIASSGVDKDTEFLLRFFALSTNSTYVFITNHSGIGDSHIEASVGDYQVEYLNDLMVRLIGKYSL